MALEKVSVLLTMNGASGDVAGMRDDEPMCMHTTVPVSSQAWKNGSQWPLGSWIEARTDLLNQTRNMVFAQCLVTNDGKPVTRASAVFKIGPEFLAPAPPCVRPGHSRG